MTGEEKVYVQYGLVQTNLSPVSNLTHSKTAVFNTDVQYPPPMLLAKLLLWYVGLYCQTGEKSKQ